MDFMGCWPETLVFTAKNHDTEKSVEWDCDEVLSSVVRSRQEWNTPLHQVTPFSKVVREQGILI